MILEEAINHFMNLYSLATGRLKLQRYNLSRNFIGAYPDETNKEQDKESKLFSLKMWKTETQKISY